LAAKNKNNSWAMYLSVPNSRSHKASIVHNSFTNFLQDTSINGKGAVLSKTYKLPAERYVKGLKSFDSIRNLKGADYWIESNGISCNKFQQGHHCFYLKETSNHRNDYCVKTSYGRLSLGCHRVPIFEALADYASFYAERMLLNRHEVFWFQVGWKNGSRWFIDKESLILIIKKAAEDLCIWDLEQVAEELEDVWDHKLFAKLNQKLNR